jgi:hypothetical protein
MACLEYALRGIREDTDLCFGALLITMLREQFQSRLGIETEFVFDDLGFTVPNLGIILGSIESTGNEFDFGFHHKPLLRL